MEPKVLILRLFSGEAEYDSGTESIQKQTVRNWDSITYSNLANREAHECVYNTIMAKAKEYDAFVKFDADMVFADEYFLEDVLNLIVEKSFDHVVAPVFDVLSGTWIEGIHAYSSKVGWELDEGEILFVDPNPTSVGRKVRMNPKKYGRSVVLHCPSPTPDQAYLYGAHRAIKACQYGRIDRRYGQYVAQWRLILTVWACWLRHGGDARRYFLAGALGAIDGRWRDVQTKSGVVFGPERADALQRSGRTLALRFAWYACTRAAAVTVGAGALAIYRTVRARVHEFGRRRL